MYGKPIRLEITVNPDQINTQVFNPGLPDSYNTEWHNPSFFPLAQPTWD
jgi:hypothetical protein